MAKVKIQGHASGTGILTVTAPNTSTDRTSTLPDATGTLLTEVADNAVTLAKMAGGTDGNIISYDASGDPVAIATGDDGQVLTSAGAGAPPAFEDAAGGTNTPSFHAYRNATQGIADNSTVKLMFTHETWDTDSAYDNSTNYRFTVPAGEGGKYFIYSQIYTSSVSAGAIDVTQFMIYKNGAEIREVYHNFNEAGFDRFTHKITAIEDLSATDYIEIYFNGNNEPTSSSYIYAHDSYFTMFKLL